MIGCLKKLKWMLAFCMTLFFLMPSNAMAAEPFDADKEVSFSINYVKDSVQLANARFKVYKVATVGRSGCAMTSDFADYPIDIYDLDQDGWMRLAETMIGYVNRDKIDYLDSGVTDSHGNLTFPTSKKVLMKPGLYLVSGDVVRIGTVNYIAKPFFVVLPMPSDGKGKSDTYEYDISVEPKCERSGIRNVVSRSVRVVWADDGFQYKRPKEVSVFLFKNGAFYDHVKLDSSKNWYYKWDKLDSDGVWSVVEKEVPGYSVKVETQDKDFVITNTYILTDDDKDKGKDKSNGGSQSTAEGKMISNTGDRKIPQTGLLWWPVWVLSFLGIVFVAAGVARKGKSRDEK